MTNAASARPPVLHYIFDPLCGWCYAAAPLLRVARQQAGLGVQWHGGGMLSGAAARRIEPDWRDHVMPHDQRIAQMTGQPFGEAYFDGLLRDIGAPLDSTPPTTALLAAESLGGRGQDLLQRLQQAHYVEGRRIAEPEVLHALAADMGLDPAAFAAAYTALEGEDTEAHIAASREWLARVGGRGFPTWALEFDHPDSGQRALQRVDLSPFLGQPAALAEQLQAWLDQLAPTPAAGSSDAADAADCADGACALPPR